MHAHPSLCEITTRCRLLRLACARLCWAPGHWLCEVFTDGWTAMDIPLPFEVSMIILPFFTPESVAQDGAILTGPIWKGSWPVPHKTIWPVKPLLAMGSAHRCVNLPGLGGGTRTFCSPFWLNRLALLTAGVLRLSTQCLGERATEPRQLVEKELEQTGVKGGSGSSLSVILPVQQGDEPLVVP